MFVYMSAANVYMFNAVYIYSQVIQITGCVYMFLWLSCILCEMAFHSMTSSYFFGCEYVQERATRFVPPANKTMKWWGGRRDPALYILRSKAFLALYIIQYSVEERWHNNIRDPKFNQYEIALIKITIARRSRMCAFAKRCCIHSLRVLHIVWLW